MIRNITIIMMSAVLSLQVYAKEIEVDLLHSWIVENYQTIELNLEKKNIRK